MIYSAISSLDGYIEDSHGAFDWAAPDDEVHAFINDLQRPVGTCLYGRRMYTTMQVWETDPRLAAASPLMADYAAIWQAVDKIVYSTTLKDVSTRKTRLERLFDPEAVRRLKAAAQRDILIAGPTLAAHAFKAGLVDICHLFLAPVTVGAGKSLFPRELCLDLELLHVRRFTSGMLHLHYQLRHGSAT